MKHLAGKRHKGANFNGGYRKLMERGILAVRGNIGVMENTENPFFLDRAS